MDFLAGKTELLGRFPVVIRLGVPVSFVVRATHLQDNVQGKMVGVRLRFPRWGCPFCISLSRGAKPSQSCQVLQATRGNKNAGAEKRLSSLLSLRQPAFFEAGIEVATHLHGLPQISQACLQAFLNGFSRRFDWWGRILIACLVEVYNCTRRGDEPCYAVCHRHDSALLSCPIICSKIPQQSLGRAARSSTLKC